MSNSHIGLLILSPFIVHMYFMYNIMTSFYFSALVFYNFLVTHEGSTTNSSLWFIIASRWLYLDLRSKTCPVVQCFKTGCLFVIVFRIVTLFVCIKMNSSIYMELIA